MNANNTTSSTPDDFDDFDDFVGDAPAEVDEAPRKHTVLETWLSLLGNTERVRKQNVTMMMAGKVLQRHPHLGFKELTKFHELFYDRIEAALLIIEQEIANDPLALNRLEDDEDVEENRTHYLNIYIQWLQLLKLDDDSWSCEDDDAGVKLAVASDVADFLVGENGIIQHLQSIEFRIDEDDMALVTAIYEEES